MLSYRQWLALLAIYVLFMLVGAVIFISLEVDYELAQRQQLLNLKEQVIELVSGLKNDTRGEVEEVLREVGEECGHDLFTLQQDDPLTWSLWNSFFFTFTVITTIGFGHMAPSTPWGRVFCVAYAFIGVPLNGIVFASLADLFSSRVVNSQVRKRAERYTTWVGVAVDALLYLVPGMMVFLVVPAAVFTMVEDDWNYLDSFYFSFITLTTIGFGDHVAGLQERDEVWVWVYKILMVTWIIFGLGYIIMVITFIQKALKCKQVHAVEKKLASALKKHTNKLNSNIHKDLKRLRMAVLVSRIHPEISDGGMKKAEKTVEEAKNGPSVTSPSSRSPIPRSASESNLAGARKEKCAGVQSVDNLNMVLDMVESMVTEHNTTAAEDMQDEMRHIVEQTDTIPSDDDDTRSLSQCEDSPSGNGSAQALEAGFLNRAYLDDDGRPVAKYNPHPHPLHDMHRHDENKITDKLQKKLNLLLMGKGNRKASLPEMIVNLSGERTRGEVGSSVCQGGAVHSNTSKPTRAQLTSRSVPGRIKLTTGEPHPHLFTVFKQPHASPGSIHPERDRNHLYNAQNSNSSQPRCGSERVSECCPEPQPTSHTKHSGLKLFTHWLHHSDPKSDEHRHAAKVDNQQGDSEEVQAEYTRL